MKQRKSNLKRIFANSVDMPETIFPGVSEISIIGAFELSVEGCRGILIYENEEIHLRLSDRVLCIKGENLTMKSYFGSHISVQGNIDSVSFEDE